MNMPSSVQPSSKPMDSTLLSIYMYSHTVLYHTRTYASPVPYITYARIHMRSLEMIHVHLFVMCVYIYVR